MFNNYYISLDISSNSCSLVGLDLNADNTWATKWGMRVEQYNKKKKEKESELVEVVENKPKSVMETELQKIIEGIRFYYTNEVIHKLGYREVDKRVKDLYSRKRELQSHLNMK